MEEIGRHGYNVSPGLIYPTLKSLEAKELIKSNKRVVKGKIRKYYETTQKGLEVLDDSKKKILELVNEMLK
jgi:DNA-binding PadR family transcriptional regulator